MVETNVFYSKVYKRFLYFLELTNISNIVEINILLATFLYYMRIHFKITGGWEFVLTDLKVTENAKHKTWSSTRNRTLQTP